jgi:hypothetical protein
MSGAAAYLRSLTNVDTRETWKLGGFELLGNQP